MISPSTWEKVIQNNGLSREEGLFSGEPFGSIVGAAATMQQQGYSPAKVSVTVGNAIEYNAVKVSVTITVSCPQNEQHIQYATEVSFLKALEMVNEASDTLGIPRLEAPY